MYEIVHSNRIYPSSLFRAMYKNRGIYSTILCMQLGQWGRIVRGSRMIHHDVRMLRCNLFCGHSLRIRIRAVGPVA